jgi:hypothetical protein
MLDLLGVLDPDRICGIYFAVERMRRAQLRRDPAWAFHVQQVEAEMPAALAWLESLIETSQTSTVGYELARLDAGVGVVGSVVRD